MGRSIRSKRGLMLRSAKAAALDQYNNKQIQLLNNKLLNNIDIQDGKQQVPIFKPDNVSVDTDNFDTTIKLQNIIDFRANTIMSYDNNDVIKQGNRIPNQYHINPSTDKLRDHLKPLPYKPKQMSYYVSPTEANIKASNMQSSYDLKHQKANLPDDIRYIIDNEDKDQAQHIKTINKKILYRDSDAIERDNELGMMLGNTQYINKKQKTYAEKLAEREEHRKKYISDPSYKLRHKKIQKGSKKHIDIFKRAGKYSGRGKM